MHQCIIYISCKWIARTNTDNTVLWVCHTGARANHAPVTESRGTGAVCDTDVGDCAGTAGTSRGYRGLQCRAIRGRYAVSGYWGYNIICI